MIDRAAITAAFLLTCFASLNAQEQTGTIVFYRERHFATGDFKPALFCDTTELARIENGTYFQVTAPAGLHTCTVESLKGPVIEVDELAAKATYVHVKLLPGIRDHAALANTSEDEYTKEKARLKPLKEWSRDTLRTASATPTEVAKQAPATDKPAAPATSESDTGPPSMSVSRVFLTRRKSWLASGGFNPNLGTGDSHAPDFAKDFHRGCPKLEITDMQGAADYAVTIDEIGLLDALTGPANEPTFKVAVYSRSAGLLYTGGTSFLKNAVKDACNAIGAK
jgi:hypothetical protein